jgi:integrase
MSTPRLVPLHPQVWDDAAVLAAFELHMRTAKLSDVTIASRLGMIKRLERMLPCGLLEATPADLERCQQRFGGLSRATVNIYTRHVQAFYRWASSRGHITADPTGRMAQVRVHRGMPHPISEADLRMVLTCAMGGLRMAYILAAFAGLRSGEITRLRGDDLLLDVIQPNAYIQGKGGKERRVPLLPPVVEELHRAGFPRTGYVVLRDDGRPYTPSELSGASYRHLQRLGIHSTLHSCRHYFATQVVRQTKDLLLVRDLLGHSSLNTTQIYMASTIDGAQERLAPFSHRAASLIDITAESDH